MKDKCMKIHGGLELPDPDPENKHTYVRIHCNFCGKLIQTQYIPKPCECCGGTGLHDS